MNPLLSWCSLNNIQIDNRLVILPGIAVYSGPTPISSSEILVKIPKISVLSVKSCSAAAFIESSGYGLDAQLALSLALLVELERGPDSRWYGYIQSLPDGIVDLPLFWAATSKDGREALKWLKGTEVERLIRGPGGIPLIDHIRQYFDQIVVPIMARLEPSGSSFHRPSLQQQFFRAYSLVSSRAFLVDAYHGLSMVPIADAFNHTYDHHVHLETEYQVCPECGSLQQCPHDRDDIQNDTSASGSGLSEDDDSYDMVSNTDIPPHSEVFNTYGETLTNAQLLVQYGFILDVNENDHISWQYDNLVHSLDKIVTLSPTTPLGSSFPWSTIVQAFNPDILFISDSELISNHNERSAIFCINCEGKISWQLWLLITCYNCARVVPVDETIALLPQIGRYLVAQETHDGDVPENNLIPLLVKATVSAVVALCQQRKACLGDGKNLQNLGDMLDELDSSHLRTRFALLQVITELSILNSCEAAWEETFPQAE